MAKKAKSASKNNRIQFSLGKQQLLFVIVVVVALVLGFGSGLLYQRHQDDNGDIHMIYPDPVICNCPFTPVHGNALHYCRC